MPYRHDDLNIEQRLKGELDKAREAYGAASREFDLLIMSIPSRIPQRAGDLRIQKTGEASRAVLQDYLFALKRFSRYTLSTTTLSIDRTQKAGYVWS
jgi:hypothetical protein